MRLQLNPAITDPRVMEIRLKQMRFFGPLREFFLISFNGNSGNPPITYRFCWFLEIRYSGIQLRQFYPISTHIPTLHHFLSFRQCKFSVLISILGLLRIINAIFIFQCISAERYITLCACAGRRKNNCNFHLSSFCVINGRGNFENGKKRFSSIIEDIFMRFFFV